MTADRTFHLRNIPCQPIWDFTNDEDFLIPTKIKKGGVKFGDLTEGAKAKLLDFIENSLKLYHFV
jgi:hypothetical protein